MHYKALCRGSVILIGDSDGDGMVACAGISVAGIEGRFTGGQAQSLGDAWRPLDGYGMRIEQPWVAEDARDREQFILPHILVANGLQSGGSVRHTDEQPIRSGGAQGNLCRGTVR